MDLHLHVDCVLAATRTGPDGLVVETVVADYTQTVACQLHELPKSVSAGVDCPPDTEVQIWGGGVIVFEQWGTPRYHVTKNILFERDDRRRQQRRLAYLADNAIFDTKGRLGFSTGDSNTARFDLLHQTESSSAERW